MIAARSSPAAAPGARSAAARAPHGRATGTPRSSTTGRRCRRIPTASTTRSRSSARCSARRSGTWTRRGCSKRADSSRTRCANTAAPASSIRRTARSPPRCSRWSGGSAIWPRRRVRSPPIQQLQQAARQSPEPLLNPASRDPIDVVFNNASLRDILNSMGMSAGINVTFERDYARTAATRCSCAASRSSRR